MRNMLLRDEVNSRFRELWKDNWASPIWKENNKTGGLMRLWPHQYNELKHNSLVIVGLNPSFEDKDWIGEGRYVKLNDKSDLDNPATLANLLFVTQVRINGMDAKDPHPYYKQFKKIADSMRTDWQPVELFCVREKNQNVLRKHLGLEGGKKRSPIDFAKKQWEIFWQIIEEIQPTAIIVANALASELILNPVTLSCDANQKFELKFDDASGDYWLKSGHGSTPIFFSGMIYGKRPLDIGSRERLLWHVKRALNQRKT